MGYQHWKLHADVPTKIISQRGMYLLDKQRTSEDDWNARGSWADNMVFEPLVGGLMLAPQYRNDLYQYPAEYYQVFPGVVGQEWITLRDCWGEANAYWLCRKESLMVDSESQYSWAAYLNPGACTLAEDQGLYYDMYLLPAADEGDTSNRLGTIYFYPRVSTSFAFWWGGGQVEYWAPYRFVLAQQKMYVQKNNNQYPQLDEDPSEWVNYTTVYEHPFDAGIDLATDFFSCRNRIWFLPIDNKRLLVKAPFLRNRGFIYFIEEEHNTYDIFPSGSAGVVVGRAGAAFLQIVPAYFPEGGEFFSNVRQMHSSHEYTFGDASLDFMVSAPTACGYAVWMSLRNEDGSVPSTGDVIDKYRYRIRIDVTNHNYTPVVSDIAVKFDAATTTTDFTPQFIEDDVLSLEESCSEDQGSLEVSLQIRDLEGKYTDWANRASIALDYNWYDDDVEIPRARLVMDSAEYDEENKILKMTCRDGWKRLDNVLLCDVSRGDGKEWTEYVEELLLWAGWDESLINIYEEDAPVLPEANYGEDSMWQPRTGVTLGDFIRELHNKWAPEDRMSIAGDGTFTIVRGEDFTPSSSKKFYWSHADAEDAGAEPYQVIEENSWREYLDRESFRNLIWVVGALRDGRPIVSYYADTDSVTNTSSEYYVGEWRMMIKVDEGLRTQEATDWVCRSLATQFARLRKAASFRSHFYPELRVGDFIEIDDNEVELWEITGIRYSINANTMYKDATDGEKVRGCEYTIREWVAPYSE